MPDMSSTGMMGSLSNASRGQMVPPDNAASRPRPATASFSTAPSPRSTPTMPPAAEHAARSTAELLLQPEEFPAAGATLAAGATQPPLPEVPRPPAWGRGEQQHGGGGGHCHSPASARVVSDEMVPGSMQVPTYYSSGTELDTSGGSSRTAVNNQDLSQRATQHARGQHQHYRQAGVAARPRPAYPGGARGGPAVGIGPEGGIDRGYGDGSAGVVAPSHTTPAAAAAAAVAATSVLRDFREMDGLPLESGDGVGLEEDWLDVTLGMLDYVEESGSVRG